MPNPKTNQIRVIQPGPMTLVQDRGRTGYQQLGVSVSGAVDSDALDIGNRLVGNDPNAAGIEVMLGGLEIEFTRPTVVAITGADPGATLDGVPVATNVSYVAHDGAVMRLGMIASGLRAYVSLAGGIKTDQILNSRSTHVASEIGGIAGRALAQGDELELGESTSDVVSGTLFENEDFAIAGGDLTVRVVLGPQDDEFSAAGIETLVNSTYTVSDQSNRQGLRLDGPVIESKSGRYDIISDAVVNGSVQVPGDGKPIILLADRQTTGGYAKIATVSTIDLPKLGQASPGTRISFEVISVEQAQDLLVTKNQMIQDSELVQVVESMVVRVDDEDVAVGVAEKEDIRLAAIDGDIYPISVEEYSPAE